MPFKRDWDDTCPKIWDTWQDGGATWTIEDLAPEDDDEAVQMMVDEFLKDEALCKTKDVSSDPVAVECARQFWYNVADHRTSIACYRREGDVKQLVALNMCPVKCVDDPKYTQECESSSWQTVVDALTLADVKCDAFKALGVDRYLGGAGLSVRRIARGAGLGAKLLKAREPLCRSIGLPATVTLFTGPISQKSATRAGFQVLTELSFAECSDAGLKVTRDENIVMKLMAKKYQ